MTILLNSQLYTGREILLMKGKDQPEITEPTKCYLCDGDSAVGECVVANVEPYPGFPGAKFAREKLGMNSAQYMDFKGNSEVSGWTVADHQEYERPVALSSWGIKKGPKTWAYPDGSEPEDVEPESAEVESESVPEPAEIEQEAPEPELVEETTGEPEGEGQEEAVGSEGAPEESRPRGRRGGSRLQR